MMDSYCRYYQAVREWAARACHVRRPLTDQDVLYFVGRNDLRHAVVTSPTLGGYLQGAWWSPEEDTGLAATHIEGIESYDVSGKETLSVLAIRVKDQHHLEPSIVRDLLNAGDRLLARARGPNGPE